MVSSCLVRVSFHALIFHMSVVCASPAPVHSVTRNIAVFQRAMQDVSSPHGHVSTSSVDGINDHSTVNLPSVTEVFRIVAEKEKAQSQIAPDLAPTSEVLNLDSIPEATPSQVTPSPPAPQFTATDSSITSPALPIHTPIYAGPGLAVAPTAFAKPELSPTMEADAVRANNTNFATPTSTSAGRNPHKSPAGKLVVVGLIMAGLLVSIFIVYFVFNRSLFAACWKRKEEQRSWTKIDYPSPPESFLCDEKPVDSAAPVQTNQSMLPYASQAILSVPASRTMYAVTSPNCVLDIRASYPRSRFSDCSSVDSQHARDSVSTSAYSAESMPNYDTSNQMNASSPHSAQESCPVDRTPETLEGHQYHYKVRRSAPAYSHPVQNYLSASHLRLGEHRKSRSVSGLTYTVKLPGDDHEGHGSPDSDVNSH